ncbi:MAG: hypothetical protein D3914_09240 [Candidatus Electrothrix sp. LOE2]|nr:hypothetical protein [Candidatus Electrothrix sp. LOE2]
MFILCSLYLYFVFSGRKNKHFSPAEAAFPMNFLDLFPGTKERALFPDPGNENSKILGNTLRIFFFIVIIE